MKTSVSVKLLETYYRRDEWHSIYAASNIPLDGVPWERIDELIKNYTQSEVDLLFGLRFHIDLTSEKQNTKIVCFEK